MKISNFIVYVLYASLCIVFLPVLFLTIVILIEQSVVFPFVIATICAGALVALFILINKLLRWS